MYIYNITFVMLPESRERFLSWMREEAVPGLFGTQSDAREPRLQEVVEIGGEKPAPEHGLCIALHACFDSEAEAHEWHDTLLSTVLGDFTRKFGPNAAFFITLLSVLPL